MFKIFYRYVIKEFITIFIFSIIIFTLLLMMGRIFDLTKLIVVQGVPAHIALSIFVYTIPLLMVYTIPMSSLLSTLLAVGRLNSDSEIIAIQSGGVHPRNLLAVFIVTSLGIGWLTFYNFNDFAPKFYTVWKDTTTNLAKSRPNALFDEGALVVGDIKIYVTDFDRKSNKLKDVYIYDSTPGQPEKTIHAGEASLKINTENSIYLILNNGQVIQRNLYDTETLHIQKFNVLWLELPLEKGKRALKRIKKPKEYTIRQLFELINDRSHSINRRRQYGIEFHKKLALPFSVVLFVLVGFPLGLGNIRYGRSWGFSISMGVFFLYYILLSFGETLTIEYGWPPLISIWMPDMVLGATGLILNRIKGVL